MTKWCHQTKSLKTTTNNKLWEFLVLFIFLKLVPYIVDIQSMTPKYVSE